MGRRRVGGEGAVGWHIISTELGSRLFGWWSAHNPNGDVMRCAEGQDVPQLELEPRAIDADLRRRCAIRLGPRAADGHLGWVRSARASAQSTLTC